MSPIEKQHIKKLFAFEVGKCNQNMVEGKCNCSLYNHVDRQLAQEVATLLEAPLPKENHEVNSDANHLQLSMSILF